MRYEDSWRLRGEITSSVNALGLSVWDSRYNREDYDGEGAHGSMFTLYE